MRVGADVIEFAKLPLEGARLLHRRVVRDDRGDFARLFCAEAFASEGLPSHFPQMNRSSCSSRGVLRGLHYQVAPAAEAKVLHCVSGRVLDVMVDVRACSATFLGWHAQELTGGDGLSVYIPTGFAHGYLALSDDAVVEYLSSAPYTPACERLLRWDDPRVGVLWPIENPILSEKDANAPLLADDFRGVGS
ncbi:dTDP-4-dehydrorhamnose 3,5-epimerase [Botrimarina sp.]|uniref:dTDP-4-dehydrorhamnose 3,5-epimerase n=1 Tax=Botrimarina sp. TaxID=2795802 RepID=UPI0032EE50DD